MKRKTDTFLFKEVNWFGHGSSNDALEVNMKQEPNGHVFIMFTSVKGKQNAMDCSMGKYH